MNVLVLNFITNVSKENVKKHSGGQTGFSSDVRLMNRKKSSPPDDTATEESTPLRQFVAHVKLSLRPRIVSPEETVC